MRSLLFIFVVCIPWLASAFNCPQLQVNGVMVMEEKQKRPIVYNEDIMIEAENSGESVEISDALFETFREVQPEADLPVVYHTYVNQLGNLPKEVVRQADGLKFEQNCVQKDSKSGRNICEYKRDPARDVPSTRYQNRIVEFSSERFPKVKFKIQCLQRGKCDENVVREAFGSAVSRGLGITEPTITVQEGQCEQQPAAEQSSPDKS